MDICTTLPCGKIASGKLLLSSVLCDDLEGWDGSGGGREALEGGDIWTHRADSCCYTAETNATL